MSLSPSSAPASQIEALPPVGCVQAVLGLIFGVIASGTLIVADPFGVVTVPEPQGVDAARQAAAFEQWKSSSRVIIGSLAMTMIPLLVSGICGVFVHRSLPSSIPAALPRMLGIVALLVPASEVGSRAIERALSTGESSDILTPLAIMAFQALCISLAAPLSSSAIRRRSRGQGRASAEATRSTTEGPA